MLQRATLPENLIILPPTFPFLFTELPYTASKNTPFSPSVLQSHPAPAKFRPLERIFCHTVPAARLPADGSPPSVSSHGRVRKTSGEFV